MKQIWFFIITLSILFSQTLVASQSGKMTFDKRYQQLLEAGNPTPAWEEPLENLSNSQVDDVKVTILSDVVTGKIDGNWGFSAFVEIDVDGSEDNKRFILFDTGYAKKTLENIKELANAGDIPDFSCFGGGSCTKAGGKKRAQKIEVILSHWHTDHIEGFADIRKAYPKAFGKVHVGSGFFKTRYKKDANGSWQESGFNQKEDIKKWYNAIPGADFDLDFVVHPTFSSVIEGVPGLWLTGQVERTSGEENYPKDLYKYKDDNGNLVEDTVPDDMALVMNTSKGLVVISGCGHAGLLNILKASYLHTAVQDVFAVIGGIHLRSASRKQMAKTSAILKRYSVKFLLGSHCTGLTRIAALQNSLTGLDSNRAVIGTAGLSIQVQGTPNLQGYKGFFPNKPFPADTHTH